MRGDDGAKLAIRASSRTAGEPVGSALVRPQMTAVVATAMASGSTGDGRLSRIAFHAVHDAVACGAHPSTPSS
jgi:hypothetical protein